MPIYVYECHKCGRREESRLSVAERDNLLEWCCERLMERRFVPTSQISIPMSFVMTTGDPCLPQTEEETKTWDRDGISSRRGGRWV